jgi:hypothetical protein
MFQALIYFPKPKLADFDGKNACPRVIEGRESESDLGFDL